MPSVNRIEVTRRQIVTEICCILERQSAALSSPARFAEMSDEELSLYIQRSERLRQLSKELSDLA